MAKKQGLGKSVATVGELEHGKSKKFTMKRAGREFEALLINYQATFRYVNRCPTASRRLGQHRSLAPIPIVMCATRRLIEPPPVSVSGALLWASCKVCHPNRRGPIYARLPGERRD